MTALVMGPALTMAALGQQISNSGSNAATTPGNAAQAATTASAPTKSGSRQLSAVVVKASSLKPTAIAAAQLKTVPGGTSLIDADSYKTTRASTLADALKFQPGVLAQSADGGEATRLSIRGSGIVRAPTAWGTGVQVDFDGVPLTVAAGTPYESIEPLSLDYIEIFRGANAFDYGPLTLGGTINYVTHTGYDSSPAQLRLEYGSYGYQSEQVSSGDVAGPYDYYFSASNFRLDGFRVGSTEDSYHLIGDFGIKINPDLTTRFTVRYTDMHQGNPGFLTWAQLEKNPRQSQFSYISTRVNPGTTIISNTTNLKIDADSQLEAGVQYNNFRVDNTGGPTPSQYPFASLAGSFRYTRQDVLFDDHESDTTALVQFDKILNSVGRTYSASGVQSVTHYDGYDLTFLGSNNFQLADRWWLTSGLAAVDQERDVALSAPKTFALDKGYFNIVPRLGIRYDVTPNWQVYGNLSRSVEAPILLYYPISTAGVVTSFANLKEQTADTVEIGTGGEEGPFKWNVDFYQSWVQNELLTVLVAPPTTTATANVPHSQHQGVELNLDTVLWQAAKKADEAKDKNAPPQRLVLRQAFTWNNFTYDHDPVYGNNELAGVPVELYQADLRYEDASGFYIGANMESSLTRYAADFANTIWAQPYAIFGAEIGYRDPGKHWEVFFAVQNLADAKYAAVVSPIYNAHGVDSAAYAPGVYRDFSGGASYRF